MDFDDLEVGGGDRVRAAGRHLKDTKKWLIPAAMLLVQLPAQFRKLDSPATGRVNVAFAMSSFIFAAVSFLMLMYIRSPRTALLVFPAISHMLALALIFSTVNCAILSSDSTTEILGVVFGGLLLGIVALLLSLGYLTAALRVGPGWLVEMANSSSLLQKVRDCWNRRTHRG